MDTCEDGGDSLTWHALPGGQPLLRRSGTEGCVKWIALSEDGTQLATCTLDGSVWLLPLSGEDQLGVPADSLARVLGKAGLQLTGVELSEPGPAEHGVPSDAGAASRATSPSSPGRA